MPDIGNVSINAFTIPPTSAFGSVASGASVFELVAAPATLTHIRVLSLSATASAAWRSIFREGLGGTPKLALAYSNTVTAERRYVNGWDLAAQTALVVEVEPGVSPAWQAFDVEFILVND